MFWTNKKEPHHLPIPEGRFATGCVDVMTGYTESDDHFFRLFYPTNIDVADVKKYCHRWIRWNPDNRTIKGMAKFLNMWTSVLKILIWLFGKETYIPTLFDERVCKAKSKKMPIVLFSHGYGATRYLCSTVCNELASRGCLVLSMEHRDGSACLTYYYKSEDHLRQNKKTYIYHKSIAPSPKVSYDKVNLQLKQRTKECRGLLDWLQKIDEGKAENILRTENFKLKDLQGRLDLETVVLMGHSFGGAAVLNTLANDKRFMAGIVLDGWMFPLKNEKLDIPQPVLFLNSQTFHIKANIDVMKKYSSQPCKKLYTIKHTTHESHGDTAVIYGYWLNMFMKKLDARTALKIQNHLIADFLREIIGLVHDEEYTKKYLSENSDNIVEDFILYSRTKRTKVSLW